MQAQSVVCVEHTFSGGYFCKRNRAIPRTDKLPSIYMQDIFLNDTFNARTIRVDYNIHVQFNWTSAMRVRILSLRVTHQPARKAAESKCNWQFCWLPWPRESIQLHKASFQANPYRRRCLTVTQSALNMIIVGHIMGKTDTNKWHAVQVTEPCCDWDWG